MTDDPTFPPPGRTSDGRFAPGNPGGPGRPRGGASAAAYAEFDRMTAAAHEAIVRTVIDKALAGDLRAIALLWSRQMPGQRRRPAAIETAPIHSVRDAEQALSAVAQAVLDGQIDSEDGQRRLKVLNRELQVQQWRAREAARANEAE
jgi:hypothetical protein